MFIWSKIVERGREGVSSHGDEIIAPGKIVPYKCCLPSLNISVKRDLTQTFLLTNTVTHFQLLSVKSTEYEQNGNKPYLIDKAMWGKMGGVYVTIVHRENNDMQ